MSILVVGSVAFDTLKTPFGERKKILGGAATYFSLSASFFTQVRVVGVVGDDFTPEHEAVLTARGIDTRGIEHASGKTFHWGGEYGENVNEAKTNFTDLNVFENFEPKIPAAYDDSEILFLANIQPELQLDVRRKMPRVALVGGDTMNLWINIKRAELLETLRQVDILLINDGEAKLLASETQPGPCRPENSYSWPQVAGYQARRIRCHDLFRRRLAPIPRPGVAHRRGSGPDRCR